MKTTILVLLLGAVLVLQGCAPSRLTKMSAVASSDQKVGYEDTITSRKKHFVSLGPYTELNVAKDRTMLMLGIQNFGDKPFDIGYGNISVRFQDSAMELPISSINVQPYDEFALDVREEQSAKEKKYIRDELEDVLITLYAYSALSSTEDSTSEDSSSSDSSFDTSDTTEETVDMVLDELEMDIEIMRTNNQLLREALPQIVMEPRVTLIPGGNYSGVVVCDTRDLDEKMEGRFQVAVLVDGEHHIFTFNRVLNK